MLLEADGVLLEADGGVLDIVLGSIPVHTEYQFIFSL